MRASEGATEDVFVSEDENSFFLFYFFFSEQPNHKPMAVLHMKFNLQLSPVFENEIARKKRIKKKYICIKSIAFYSIWWHFACIALSKYPENTSHEMMYILTTMNSLKMCSILFVLRYSLCAPFVAMFHSIQFQW